MDLNNWLDTSLPGVVSELHSANMEFTRKERSIGSAGKKQVYDVIKALRSALFPGVYDENPIDQYHMEIFIGNELRCASMLLAPLIEQAFYNECRREDKDHAECRECANKAAEVTAKLIGSLPEIRDLLSLDIQAAYDGDPAVRFREEILLSYPYINAITVHRIAHILYSEHVPVIPRIMSEFAHQETGIDINPGAKIGKSFFIDHGT
ncbi:MAG: serine acetyltransferase, partial [Clostridiales bacterium]|nr:serine acetyltransferase [Clostridiales bacterium]